MTVVLFVQVISCLKNLSRQLLGPKWVFLFSPCLNSKFVAKLVEWDDRIFVLSSVPCGQTLAG